MKLEHLAGFRLGNSKRDNEVGKYGQERRVGAFSVHIKKITNTKMINRKKNLITKIVVNIWHIILAMHGSYILSLQALVEIKLVAELL